MQRIYLIGYNMLGEKRLNIRRRTMALQLIWLQIFRCLGRVPPSMVWAGHHCDLHIDGLAHLELGRYRAQAEGDLVLLHGDELALNVGDVNKVLLSALLAPDVAVAPRSTEVADCSFLGGALYSVWDWWCSCSPSQQSVLKQKTAIFQAGADAGVRTRNAARPSFWWEEAVDTVLTGIGTRWGFG